MEPPKTETTGLPELDDEAFQHACSEAIKLARKMKQRIVQDEPGVGREFGDQIAPLFRKAGATVEEGLHYAARCIAFVLKEPQA